MKRNSNIVPLSRDHHRALLFCWKIRRGLEKAASPERLRPYVLYFWNDHLEKHFQEEESLLFREVEDPQCRQAIAEHQQIEDLIASVREGDSSNSANYSQLADLVEKHVRFEERQLFPFLEKAIPEDRLSEIGAQLENMHGSDAADVYQDEFWK